jgi:hypothetical protein
MQNLRVVKSLTAARKSIEFALTTLGANEQKPSTPEPAAHKRTPAVAKTRSTRKAA